jgi:hypothetical protein
MGGDGSEAIPKVLVEGGGSDATPHELMEGGGSGTTPYEPMEGSGSGVAPPEARETSPPTLEQELVSKWSHPHEMEQGSRGSSPKCTHRPKASEYVTDSPRFLPLFFRSDLMPFFYFVDSCDGATLWGQHLGIALLSKQGGSRFPASPLFRAGVTLLLWPRWLVR